MKRVGNVFEEVCSLDNIREAHRNAKRGKSTYRDVIKIEANPLPYFKAIREMLLNKTYKVSPYETFIKKSSVKEREIYKLPYFPDRIIQHCIIQVMKPIWMKTLIRHTYASLNDRGVHDCVRHIQDRLRKQPDSMEYCLQLDIRKYFPSINCDIMKNVIRKKLKDPDLLWLIDEIIDSSNRGLPVGNYLSQFLGNLYLSELDHYIKEELNIHHYFRYCDDLVLFSDDKSQLHSARMEIEQQLNMIRLELKRTWRVFNIKDGLDFLGYKFFPTHTLIRRRNVDSFRFKIKKFKKNPHKYTFKHKHAIIASYFGWFQHGNGWNLFDSVVNEC